MRPVTIRYERLKNSGNFEHEKVAIEVLVEEGETATMALERAKKFVEKALGDGANAIALEKARRILENPDDYTPKEYRRAQELLGQESDIPF